MRKGKKRRSKITTAVVFMAFAVGVFGIAHLALTYYTTNSYLTLNGERSVTVGLNGLYEEKGAKAEIAGLDFSDSVKIKGKVNAARPGNYKLVYSCGHFSMTRKVTVLNKMSPFLDVGGPEKSTITLGDKFENSSYSAKDDSGNDLTSKVKITGDDYNRAGVHNVKYTVTDSDGKTTQIIRKVAVKPSTKFDTPGLPICMFHYVYDEKNPPADLHQRWGNYIGAAALTEEINWLKSENYYFPNWKEVRDYVDGKLILPEKSVVLTFDDCAKSFLQYGIPVLENCRVVGTSFVITSQDGEKKVAEHKSKYVDYESHSDNMHRPGGKVGHGGIFTAISREDGLADLKKSIEIVGNSNAFAYPYGDYNDRTISMVKEAGFLCAVTTQPGKARPGDNPLVLPLHRMSVVQNLKEFQF